MPAELASQQRLAAAYAAFVVAETATAFHEAGHAVVCCALGRPPLRAEVCIKPGREVLALVTSAGTEPQSVLDGCCVLLAGYFAQIRHLEITGAPIVFDDIADLCAVDFRKVDELLALFNFASALTFEVLFTETKRLVDENWPATVRVAAALLEHETLDTAQIVAAFNLAEAA